MTKIITFLFILFITFVSAQEIDHSGTYFWSVDPINAGIHSRTLTIYADGTFTFERFRAAHNINPDNYIYGKGTWTAEGKYVYFTTDPETEIDEKYTLNFTNTKGRWDARNNRLILFESDIFWLKRFTIQKQ